MEVVVFGKGVICVGLEKVWALLAGARLDDKGRARERLGRQLDGVEGVTIFDKEMMGVAACLMDMRMGNS